MPNRSPSTRRLFAPLILATMLACEVAGLASAARVAPPSAVSLPEATAVSGAGSGVGHIAGAPGGAAATARTPQARALLSADETSTRRAGPASAVAERRVEPDHSRPTRNRASGARPDVTAEADAVTTVVKRYVAPSRSAGAAVRSGRNHVWIPSLGINRSVESFPCDRSRPPDNYVYRWGCAGRNNVYLMGHAHSVFKPLHDAYVKHRLRKGMIVYYADGSGRVRTYAVVWGKLTPPTTSASWAWAAQSRPSMTLQTCIGANNDNRLMVRLVATD